MKEIITISILVIVLAIALSTSKALDIQANVTVIERTCGLELVGTQSIQFGNVIQGFESPHDEVAFRNPGNIVTTDANVKGSNWIGTTYSMNVSLTNFTDKSFGNPVWQLDTQPRTIWTGYMVPGNVYYADFWIKIPIDQQPDTYTQNITFTVTC